MTFCLLISYQKQVYKPKQLVNYLTVEYIYKPLNYNSKYNVY